MLQKELLTVDEVADLLRTTPNTIYRWLRAGKLRGVKIGKEWRLSRDTLLSRLLEEERDSGGKDFFDSINPKQDHVLVITNSQEELYDMEAEYFEKGANRGHRLFKGCWWQHPDDVRTKLSDRGIDVEDLEKQDRMVIVNLDKTFQERGLEGPVDAWVKESEKSSILGFKTMWGAGSPLLNSCGEDVNMLIDFESLLDKNLRKRQVVGICPYVFRDCGDNFIGPLLELVNHHNSLVLYDRGRTTILRK